MQSGDCTRILRYAPPLVLWNLPTQQGANCTAKRKEKTQTHDLRLWKEPFDWQIGVKIANGQNPTRLRIILNAKFPCIQIE